MLFALLFEIINIFKEAHMTSDHTSSIAKHFSNLADPRRYNKRHKLMDIITLAICGVICNADSFEHISEFGRAKHQWLNRFLELAHGIPSPDTFEADEPLPSVLLSGRAKQVSLKSIHSKDSR